jgi:hypothetical protein
MGRRDDMRERKCGCIYYCYGPPLLCPTHQAKQQEEEETGLRKLVKDQCEGLGHKVTRFSEYESQPGKWTAYCETCGKVIIVYDEPPRLGDQINSPCLTEVCRG